MSLVPPSVVHFWHIRVGLIFALIAIRLLLAPLSVAANEPPPVIHVTDQPASPATLRISASQPIQLVNVLAQPAEIEIVQQQFRAYLPLLVGGAGSPAGVFDAPASEPQATRVRLAVGQTLPYSFIQSGVYTRDGNWLRSTGQDDQVLGIAPLAPASWNVSFGNNGKPFAEISPAQRSDDVRLVHLLYPTTGSAWASRPTARVTADTGQALHVRVTFADGSYDDVLIAYN